MRQHCQADHGKNSGDTQCRFPDSRGRWPVLVENLCQPQRRLARPMHSRLRHRPSPMCQALFQQRDQTSGVSARVGSFGQHRIVTRHFAFHRKPLFNPPHRWMKKEESAYDFLNQIGPLIPAPQVREFVQQHDVEIFGRQFSQRPRGKDNRPPPETDGRRYTHAIGRSDPYRP